MRAKRTDLENQVPKSVMETNPGLRNSIREALDKGATPKQIRAKWGVRSPLGRREPMIWGR